MRRLGAPLEPEYVQYGDYSIECGARLVRDLLSLPKPPTAIFAGNDDMAIGAINEAKALGRRLPDELSVIGFDDVPFAASCDPSLTTIRQPFSEMGASAMAALSALLEGKKLDERTILLPTELIVRKSVTSPG